MSDNVIVAIIAFILAMIVIIANLFNIIYKNKYLKYNEFVKKLLDNSLNNNEMFLLIYKTNKFYCYKEFDKLNEFVNFQKEYKNYISVIKSYKLNNYDDIQYVKIE